VKQLNDSSRKERVANKYDCECGRSPNGKCLGWHKLSEIDYKMRLANYLKKRDSKAA